MGMISWPWFGLKGVIWFVPLWTIFEVVYRMRVRAALRCRNCGFDPYLFLVDVQKAKTEVDAHWRKLFEEKGVPYPEKNSEKSVDRTVPNP
jgi:hypothetical protein